MFTERAQHVINLAVEEARYSGKDVLNSKSLLAALASNPEGSVRLAECLTGGDVEKLRSICPLIGDPTPLLFHQDYNRHTKFDQHTKSIIENALELASVEGVPDRSHPGYINVRHLACATAMSEMVTRDLPGGINPLDRNEALQLLTDWSMEGELRDSIGGLVNRLRDLRSELLARIFGQDHAVHAFVEGLYNAEITTSIDQDRKKPAAVFVFAGPPGVGKTYMSELSASFLGRPFRRFDMTGYTDHQAHNQLVGFARSYKGAQPGMLTGFVDKNPNGIILFDEIEKAHLNTMQLFYQILDAGRLEDKFTEEDVSFRDTIIIFTTNAGRILYDNPNQVGIGAVDAGYHRRTILSALEQEKNPTTGQPAFPPAICSRLGQGYPLMFNHLGVNELIKVSETELKRTAALLEKKYLKRFIFDPLLPISLVFSSGGRTDARELRTDTDKIVKRELFKFAALYDSDRVEDVFEEFDQVHFSLENVSDIIDSIVRELYIPQEKPKVLLVAGKEFARLCRGHITDVHWYYADTKEETAALLASTDIDLVLLDLWLPAEKKKEDEAYEDGGEGKDGNCPQDWGKTLCQGLDFVPLSARALTRGREILRKIHDSFPEKPVYILSFEGKDKELPGEVKFATFVMDAAQGNWDITPLTETSLRRAVDEELFLACVRSGGARGLISTDFSDDYLEGWPERRDHFADQLKKILGRVYRESRAQWLARQRKVLCFDTAVDLDHSKRLLTIRLRDFQLKRAVEASDAGEMVDDVQRPTTRFEDVIGAAAAKESLGFVVDWLKEPGYYSALGVRPPKGVLLTGPPGTGKTMLARAVAGESDCAYLEKAATSFVTVWQGSGPQNIRDLFARARRYAPAIVFIDEIDAVGVARSGGGGGGRAAEETLNALLTEMDGFTSDRLRPVIVLAATNLAERLDEALRRRFDRIIEVDRPDRDARLAYLKKAALKGRESSISEEVLKRMAGQAAGMSIADLERIVQEASVMAARDKKPLNDAALEASFEKIRMGEESKPPDYDTLERVARHEAGHALIAWMGGNLPVQLTIIGRGGAAGYMEREQDEEKIIMTKPEIQQLIREAMGGRAAELLFYGEEEGLSTGAAGDLQQASRLAKRMVCDYAMEEEYGCINLAGNFTQGENHGALADRAAAAAERIVKQELEKACRAAEENRAGLEQLARILLEKNRLVRDEIKDILENS